MSKRITLLLSLIIVLSMVLGACSQAPAGLVARGAGQCGGSHLHTLRHRSAGGPGNCGLCGIGLFPGRVVSTNF